MKNAPKSVTDQLRCSCCRGQQEAVQNVLPPLPPSVEFPSINIQSSNLNCVIIGDNNYMYTEQAHTGEIDEPQM